jgi:hypothetical protein
MEAFINLYTRMLVFIYHCFDRIMIHGYLSMLSRPAKQLHSVWFG